MAEKSRFFRSESGDRKYTADEFAEYFRTLIKGGVFGEQLNSLQVTADDGGMYVYLDTGRAFIEGYYYENDAQMQLSIEAADPSNPRIDRVILRLDTVTERAIKAVVKKGTPAASPTPPSLTRDLENSGIYEISLAQVYVPAATGVITANDITDERSDETVCGYVRYQAKPAWYPSGVIPVDLWLYAFFRNELTLQEISDIESNSTLMDKYNNSNHIGKGGSEHAEATTSTAGFMSAADKQELNKIPVLDERITRNEYDDYLSWTELYYTGHFSGPTIESGTKGVFFDAFADTSLQDGSSTANIDTTNKCLEANVAAQDTWAIDTNAHDNYNQWNYTEQKIYGSRRRGQTFKAPYTGYYDRVMIKYAGGSESISDLRGDIYEADVNGHPTGSVLAYAQMAWQDRAYRSKYISLNQPVLLEAGKQYVIVWRAVSGDGDDSSSYHLICAQSGDLYPDGKMIYSNDGGNTWADSGAGVDQSLQVEVVKGYTSGTHYSVTKTLEENMQNVKMYISCKGGTITPEISLDGGNTYKTGTIVNSRTDPNYTDYTEYEVDFDFTSNPGSQLKVKIPIDPLEYVKRFSVMFS